MCWLEQVLCDDLVGLTSYHHSQLVLKTVIRVAHDNNADTGSARTFFGAARLKSNLGIFDDEENGRKTCAICLSDYEEGDQICWSNNQDCLHHFHSTCGIAWLAKHSQCPICRAEYLVEPDTRQEKEIVNEDIETPFQLNSQEQVEELQSRADAPPINEALPDENV